MTPHEGPLAAADCLVPDWPAPEGVFALCTTRTGGVSLPPYDSLNLGTHVGDDAAAVHTNRMRLQSTVAAVVNGTRAVFLNQVHGDGVVHLDAAGIVADCLVACLLEVGGQVALVRQRIAARKGLRRRVDADRKLTSKAG